MEDSSLNDSLNGIQLSSPFELQLDYDNYLNERRLASGRRILFNYNGSKIGLTQKQINVLKLVAKGFSNAKIAQCLSVREQAIKLLIYRLMKYIEKVLHESVDRFYLIVIAQQLGLDEY
jgi:DNA-binding CsgD family transcriptional regulator